MFQQLLFGPNRSIKMSKLIKLLPTVKPPCYTICISPCVLYMFYYIYFRNEFVKLNIVWLFVVKSNENMGKI